MDKLHVTNEVSKLVSNALTEASMSKLTLARESGIPYATLDRKIRGFTDFTISELFRVAKTLEVPLENLIPCTSALPAVSKLKEPA